MHKIYFEKRCIVICRNDEAQLADPNSVEFHIGEKIDIHALVGMFEASATLSRIYIPTDGRQEEEIYRRLCSEFREVNAAGGLVSNRRGDYLLIRRDGLWDLPKGHQEPGEDIRRGPEEGHEPAQLYPQAGIEGVLLFKPVPLVALPAEGPHHPDAGEVLLHHGGEPALVLIALLEALAELMMEKDGIPDDDRQGSHGDEGQGHVHAQHEDHGHDQHDKNPDEAGHLLGDEIAGGVDIAGAALDDIPGVVLHMPLEGQAGNMAVKGIPHILHQGFAAPGIGDPEPVLGGHLHHGHRQDGQGHNPQPGTQGLRAAEGIGIFPGQFRIDGVEIAFRDDDVRVQDDEPFPFRPFCSVVPGLSGTGIGFGIIAYREPVFEGSDNLFAGDGGSDNPSEKILIFEGKLILT